MTFDQEIPVRIVEGHGVASGRAGDNRFPEGTLSMQIPFFAEYGLDLSNWHRGTINVSISPHRYEIGSPFQTFRKVKWHKSEPAEDFSFFNCRLNGKDGLIYYPHPETKPEHEQPDDVLEIWLPIRLPDLTHHSQVIFSVPSNQIMLK